VRIPRLLGPLAGTTVIALALLTVASPASAAILPAGQKITIIDALDDEGPQEGPFFDVNPADAAATPVGTGSGVYTYGLDVNDDGLGFAIGGFGEETIWKADANTGTISDPVPLHFATEPAPYDCADLDINPVTGEVLVACVWFTNETGNVSTIDIVDPATGLLTPVLSLSGLDYVPFDAIATNPVTGVLWAFGAPETIYNSYIIDRTLQTATYQATMADPVFGADFDRSGQLFVTSQVGGLVGDPSLGVVDPAVGFTSNTVLVNSVDGLELDRVYSITVWGKEALPATGPAEMLPLGLGTALLLLAGAAFIATGRISTSLDHRRRAA
jgi:hypothetical protein